MRKDRGRRYVIRDAPSGVSFTILFVDDCTIDRRCDDYYDMGARKRLGPVGTRVRQFRKSHVHRMYDSMVSRSVQMGTPPFSIHNTFFPAVVRKDKSAANTTAAARQQQSRQLVVSSRVSRHNDNDDLGCGFMSSYRTLIPKVYLES